MKSLATLRRFLSKTTVKNRLQLNFCLFYQYLGDRFAEINVPLIKDFPMYSLQTLLAFSDGIDGSENSDLTARRIAQDPNAAQLLLRLDFAMKSARLEAPDIFDPDVFPNANLVAEYLDRRLDDSRRIFEYEKACFESDVLLAEVGACYDILNHRLRIPVEISRRNFHRLYSLPYQNDSSPAETNDFDEKSQKTPQNKTKAVAFENIDSNDELSVSRFQSDGASENVSTSSKSLRDRRNKTPFLATFESVFQHFRDNSNADRPARLETNRPDFSRNDSSQNARFAYSSQNDDRLDYSTNQSPQRERSVPKNKTERLDSDRKLDLAPRFSVFRFLFKQTTAAAVVVALVYFGSNYSTSDFSRFFKRTPSDATEIPDYLESEILEHSDRAVVRPSIISSTTAKNLPVLTVEEVNRIQNDPRSKPKNESSSADSIGNSTTTNLDGNSTDAFQNEIGSSDIFGDDLFETPDEQTNVETPKSPRLPNENIPTSVASTPDDAPTARNF